MTENPAVAAIGSTQGVGFFVDIVGHGSSLWPSMVVLTTVLMLAGCEGPLSTVDPAGPAARTIAQIWWVMLVGAGAVFVLVMVLVALAFVRTSRPVDETRHERLWVIKLGIAFPAVVLLALLAYGLIAGESLLPRQGPDVISVSAEARRSQWTFGYGDVAGRRTEHVLHIPAGRPVDVAITSTDVIHSFWVPRLVGKIDAVPGHVNVLRIEADEPGTYAGRSAEFSGVGYDQFAFTVVAHDPAAWERFIRGGTP